MAGTNHNFEKFVLEAHEYVNKLALDVGHPEEKERALIVWRAVMHTVRDRIQISESFHVMSQLPTILEGSIRRIGNTMKSPRKISKKWRR